MRQAPYATPSSVHLSHVAQQHTKGIASFRHNRFSPVAMKHIVKASFLVVLVWAAAFGSAFAQPDGEKIFKQICAACHKPTEVKGTGPGLKGVHERWGGDEAEMIKFIKQGIVGYVAGGGAKAAYILGVQTEMGGAIMPAQGVSVEEAQAVLAYIKAYVAPVAQGPPPADPNAAVDTTFLSTLNVLVGVLLFAAIAIIIIIAFVLVALRAKEQGTRFELGKVGDWLKNLRYNRFLGVTLGLLVTLFVVSFTIDEFRGIGLHQGYQPTQPIAFSHVTHAGKYEIDCQYCHIGVQVGKAATIPSTNICQNCHNERGGIVNGSVYGETELAKILVSGKTNTPIEWVRVHNLPDLVYFNHSQHVAVAGVECVTCHGPIQEMEKVYQYNVLSMGWCINCHRQTEVKQLNTNEYYRTIHAQFLGDEYNEEAVTAETLGGLNCSRCHY
jgi:mono/diheme cytochrome c family protein